jgi:hypothetical protein
MLARRLMRPGDGRHHVCCKTVWPCVLGRHFKIVTDHKPIECVFSVKDPSPRFLRWRLNWKSAFHDTLPVWKNKITCRLLVSHTHNRCEDGEREREGGSSGVGRARLNRETLLEYSGAFRQKERAL